MVLVTWIISRGYHSNCIYVSVQFSSVAYIYIYIYVIEFVDINDPYMSIDE